MLQSNAGFGIILKKTLIPGMCVILRDDSPITGFFNTFYSQ